MDEKNVHSSQDNINEDGWKLKVKATMRQQTTIQDALLMSQANLAEADFFQKTQIQNAQAFLQMDLTNLNNE